jgi:hypothetical protein
MPKTGTGKASRGIDFLAVPFGERCYSGSLRRTKQRLIIECRLPSFGLLERC